MCHRVTRLSDAVGPPYKRENYIGFFQVDLQIVRGTNEQIVDRTQRRLIATRFPDHREEVTATGAIASVAWRSIPRAIAGASRREEEAKEQTKK